MIELEYFAVHEGSLAEWERIYNPLNVRGELDKMKLWLDANPRRRKKSYQRFVINWLNKESAIMQRRQIEFRAAASVGKYNGPQSDEPPSPERQELYQLIDDYHRNVTHADEHGERYKISPSSRQRVYLDARGQWKSRSDCA